jgi:hypothetical protein
MAPAAKAPTFEPTLTALADPTTMLGIDWADYGALYPDWRGLNYDGDLTVKDIAAIVRRELRKAIKAGTLGTATAVSVRYRTGSMMQAIDTVLTVPKAKVDADTPGAVQYEDRWGELHWVVKDPGDNCAGILVDDRVEPGAREAKRKAEAFIATFNYNRSNSQIDYFDRNFYGGVELREA